MLSSHRPICYGILIFLCAMTAALAQPSDVTITPPPFDEASSEPTDEANDKPSDEAVSKPAEEECLEKGLTPQVEIYIPSVKKLFAAAKRSKTAVLYEALSGLMPVPKNETDEGFDLAALMKLIEKIGTWPDTSIAVTTYTQDRDGRPRWALRLDWPLEELTSRLQALLKEDAATKLLESVALRRNEDDTYRLEMQDVVLAVLSSFEEGVLIASARDLQPPASLFGQKTSQAESTDDRSSKQVDGQKKVKRSLIYCRLNLGAGGEDRHDSIFTKISGVHNVLYAVTLKKSGLWRERFVVRWNPLLGIAMKAMFQKNRRPYKCPEEAYAVAVMNLGIGEGLADGLAGLPPQTIGTRVGTEMAFAAVPGSGFLPFPDLFYQFRTRRTDSIIKAIQKFIAEDNKKRLDEDRLPAWHEDRIEGKDCFWKDSSVDQTFGLLPVNYRTVIFFDKPADDESKRARLIIALTSTWADDAVRRWKELSRHTITVPSSKKAHWQARLGWKRIYGLLQPYMALLAGFTEDATIPPDAEEIDEALVDSVFNVSISYSGLKVKHTGPVPVGVFYLPTVVVASLSATEDPSSEAARERTASRHLRVLYHHAKLFQKDYGRWPATVSELDGYVDFASHTHLLHLRSKDRSFVEGLTAILTTHKRPASDDAEKEDDDIDDSLYVIDWSENEAEWKLQVREGEFTRYQTIYIDTEGVIHRVDKDDEKRSGDEDKELKRSVPKKAKIVL